MFDLELLIESYNTKKQELHPLFSYKKNFSLFDRVIKLSSFLEWHKKMKGEKEIVCSFK